MGLEVPPPEAVTVAAPSRAASSLISLALVIASVTLSTGGHFTLKAGMDRVGRIGTAQVSKPVSTIARAAREPRIWIGLGLFGVSAIFWLVVLSRVALSLAYPFAALSYVAIVLLDRYVLNEHVPVLRWAGAAVIALGIALIGISSRTVAGS
jgi:undecaprenyl phosphate-alpha-L-ara4N flippase subunit ArnE